MQIITQGCAGQQQLKLSRIHPQFPGYHRLVILNLMRLIHNHHLPLNLPQPVEAVADALKARDNHVEVSVFDMGLVGLFALFLGSQEQDGLAGGKPFLQFVHPVAEGCKWGDDDVRASCVFELGEVREESDGLDGLSQAHVVSQDTV